MTFDVVGLGEPLFELNQQPDGRFLQGFGGDTSNATIAAARLGAKAAYITKIGSDAPGEAFLALWRAESVDTQGVTRSDMAPTGLYLVTHGPQGHQFSYYRKGSAASALVPRDIPEALIADARYLHFSAVSQAISGTAREAVAQAIDYAKRHGASISYDTNLRLKLWRLDEAKPVIAETSRHARILKTSLDDAEGLTGLSEPSAIAQHYHALGSQIVVVTLGAAGVLVSSGGAPLVIPAHQVDFKDATGAGDAFSGAFLAELCRGRPVAEAARFANAAAALSTEGYGAVAPLPRRAAVEALLARSGQTAS